MGFGQLEWLRRKISDLLNQQRVDQKADMIETNTATQNVITNTIYTDNDVTRDEIRNFNWADNDVTRDEILNNLRPLLGGGHLPTVTGITYLWEQWNNDHTDRYYRYDGKGFFVALPTHRSSSSNHDWYITIDDVALSTQVAPYYKVLPFSRFVSIFHPGANYSAFYLRFFIFFTT